jgi:hypothetical protein
MNPFAPPLLACLMALLSPVKAQAQDSEFRLQLTRSLGATDGQHCRAEAADHPELALPPLVLTQANIVQWSPSEGLLVMQGKVGASGDAARPWAPADMTDRCFELALSGLRRVTGMALASQSARLTDLPRLLVARDPQQAERWHLRLLAAPPQQAALIAAIDNTLGDDPHLARQLQRLKQPSGDTAHPEGYLGGGQRWAAAVQRRIWAQTIHAGMPTEALTALLGPPATQQPTAQARR